MASDTAREALLERAREMYGSDDVEIDPDAKVSEAGEEEEAGSWVQAWVWVPNETETEEAGDGEGEDTEAEDVQRVRQA